MQHNIELCNAADIPEGACKGFSLTSDKRLQDIFIVHRNNQFYAYKNSCPHTGSRLNWQDDVFLDYEEKSIQCSLHGALFEIETGRCIWGPCLNQALEKVDISIRENKIFLP